MFRNPRHPDDVTHLAAVAPNNNNRPTGLDDTVRPNQQAYSWNSVGTVTSPGREGMKLDFEQRFALECHWFPRLLA
jgi:hypothetical protein